MAVNKTMVLMIKNSIIITRCKFLEEFISFPEFENYLYSYWNNSFLFNDYIGNGFDEINMKNIDQGISTFNKAVQDFGDSIDTMTREMSADIEKSNKESEARERKNKKNLDKIWGMKK